MLEPYIRAMREQQLAIEDRLIRAGVDAMRIDWTYDSEWTPDGMKLIAHPRLKSDEEMIGRCSDPSCCG